MGHVCAYSHHHKCMTQRDETGCIIFCLSARRRCPWKSIARDGQPAGLWRLHILINLVLSVPLQQELPLVMVVVEALLWLLMHSLGWVFLEV